MKKVTCHPLLFLCFLTHFLCIENDRLAHIIHYSGNENITGLCVRPAELEPECFYLVENSSQVNSRACVAGKIIHWLEIIQPYSLHNPDHSLVQSYIKPFGHCSYKPTMEHCKIIVLIF